jgi:anti-sigma factor RsiW
MRIDDTELMAYVDGNLPPERITQVEAAVAVSADLAARLRALRASALPYAAAFEAQPLPPVPDELRQRVRDLVSVGLAPRRRLSSWPGLVAAFAAGVLCCVVTLRLPVPTPLLAAQVAPWVKAVSDYQTLYSRATLANVSEDPVLTAHVIADLLTNDGMVVRVPDLSSEGFSFKRVQRLNFRHQAVVQMAYLPERGEPLAVCVTRDTRPDEAPHALPLGELQSVTWRRDQLSYVVLGHESLRNLLELGRRLARGDARALYGSELRDKQGRESEHGVSAQSPDRQGTRTIRESASAASQARLTSDSGTGLMAVLKSADGAACSTPVIASRSLGKGTLAMPLPMSCNELERNAELGSVSRPLAEPIST